MDPQVQGRQDDDDFFESLRRAAARPPGAAPATLPATPPEPSDAEPRAVDDTSPATPAVPLVSSRTAEALRDLEDRIAGLEGQVRALNESHDRFVADVADAVITRLDARWARAIVTDEPPGA